jgi:hypothetical protein
MKRKFKNVNLDFEILCKMLCGIESIDGIKHNQYDMEKILNDLPARDMQKLLNNIDALNTAIGLDTIFEVTCPHCGLDFKTFFRYGPEFFRPTNI